MRRGRVGGRKQEGGEGRRREASRLLKANCCGRTQAPTGGITRHGAAELPRPLLAKAVQRASLGRGRRGTLRLPHMAGGRCSADGAAPSWRSFAMSVWPSRLAVPPSRCAHRRRESPLRRCSVSRTAPGAGIRGHRDEPPSDPRYTWAAQTPARLPRAHVCNIIALARRGFPRIYAQGPPMLRGHVCAPRTQSSPGAGPYPE